MEECKNKDDEKQNNSSKQNTEKVIKTVAVAAGITLVVVGGILLIKKRGTNFRGMDFSMMNYPSKKYYPKFTPENAKPKTILDDITLTGERLTAKEIGKIGGISAKKVNDRLIEKGLAVRYSSGVRATDLGKKVSQEVTKVTAHDYAFTNCEWDKAVIPLVITKEEIASTAEHKLNFEKYLEELKMKAV